MRRDIEKIVLHVEGDAQKKIVRSSLMHLLNGQSASGRLLETTLGAFWAQCMKTCDIYSLLDLERDAVFVDTPSDVWENWIIYTANRLVGRPVYVALPDSGKYEGSVFKHISTRKMLENLLEHLDAEVIDKDDSDRTDGLEWEVIETSTTPEVASTCLKIPRTWTAAAIHSISLYMEREYDAPQNR